MTEEQVQRLRDAGISDDVIMDMQKKDEQERSEGYINPFSPSETFAQAQERGAPVQGQPASWSQTGTEAVAMIPDAAKAIGIGGAGYGAYKLGKGVLQNRAPAPVAQAPVAPVVPNAGPQLPAANTPEGIKQTLRGGPVQPGTNPYASQTSIAERMKQIAAQRVLPVAQSMAPYLRAASGIGGMLYSPGLNTGEAEQLAEYRRRTGQQP